ncbi:MAG: hypothetical protein KF895_03315 [Parvibaculum sp.]|nr:hypothetical protein [Parvibaculum sp.]
MGTPPIEEQEFLGGVKVVQIEDLRIARGLSRRPHSACPHVRLVYDEKERRVWCKDCESDIEGFDAFRLLVERSHAHQKDLIERMAKVEEAEAAALLSLAARAIDKIWRTRKSTPCCPHCRQALLPEDFKEGRPITMSADLARAQRDKMRRATTPPKD